MNIVIAPQAFKKNLSAYEVALAIQKGIKRATPAVITKLAPVADGGDGTLDVLIRALKGSFKTAEVTGPLGEPCTAKWGVLPDGVTVVIEMALACGLSLIPSEKRNPLKTTSFGLGQLIKEALDQGFRKFVIGIGGSATNDAGIGMAKALGVRFLDEDGGDVNQINRIEKIDLSGLDPRVKESEFKIACDVSNSLIGPEGASRIYAPQKGADLQMVGQLESSMRHFAKIVKRDMGKDIESMARGGAAGGTGAGAFVFLNGRLYSGIELVMELLDFDRCLQGTDLVIVGEGRMEAQTIYDKAPLGVARRAKQQRVPVLAIVGSLGVGYSALHRQGIDAIIPLTFAKATLSQIPMNPAELISQAAEEAIRLFTAAP